MNSPKTWVNNHNDYSANNTDTDIILFARTAKYDYYKKTYPDLEYGCWLRRSRTPPQTVSLSISHSRLQKKNLGLLKSLSQHRSK